MTDNKNKEETIKVLKFCLVGFSNALVTAVVVYIMMHLFSYDYKISNICGYILSVINSFVWNKLWVFKARRTNVWKEIFWFGFAFLVAYLSQFVFLLLLVEYLGVNEYWAQFAGLFIYGAINFVMNRRLTFLGKE